MLGVRRRVEAFALFNVFYQTGILFGPLLGPALTGIDFRLTSLHFEISSVPPDFAYR